VLAESARPLETVLIKGVDSRWRLLFFEGINRSYRGFSGGISLNGQQKKEFHAAVNSAHGYHAKHSDTIDQQ
jgi:hypothetical protein